MAGAFVKKLKRGLFMTHTEFLEKVGETFQRTGPVEPQHLDRLETALIAADAGVELSMSLVDGLRDEIRKGRLTTTEELRPAVRRRLLELLQAAENAEPIDLSNEKPRVTLLVGVNGTETPTNIGN